MSRIFQSGGLLGKTLGDLGKKALLDISVPLAKDVFPKLATKATLSILDKSVRKVSGKGAVRAGKGFTLFISNKNMDDISKIVESLENSGLLIDGATETVKHEIKKQGRFGAYDFYTETTYCFVINKFYDWKMEKGKKVDFYRY